MIDYIKLNISYLIKDTLLSNPLISWKQQVNCETGELSFPILGYYKNINIRINDKRIELSGSLHKLWNLLMLSEDQNYNDFPITELYKIIDHIVQVFKLEPAKTIIENLEFGFNIITNEPPTKILSNHLIVWNDQIPSKNKGYSGKGKYIEFETSEFFLKIYDKGKQYSRQENILRIEIKAFKNEYFNKKDKTYLSKLKEIGFLEGLVHDLIKRFNPFYIVDNIKFNDFQNAKESKIFISGVNPLTWSTFPYPKKKQRFKESFDKILSKYGLDSIKKGIQQKLIEKGDELVLCHGMSNSIVEGENHFFTNLSQNEPYIYYQNVTPFYCLITGLDISRQAKNKTYVLESTIKEVFKTDPVTFEKLKTRFKPGNWNHLSFDDLCMEMAHRIRRKYQTLLEKRLKYEHSLFPL